MKVQPLKDYDGPAFTGSGTLALAAFAAAIVGSAATAAGEKMVVLGRVALPPRPPEVATQTVVPAVGRGEPLVAADVLRSALGVSVSRRPASSVWTLRLGNAWITLTPGGAYAIGPRGKLPLPAAARSQGDDLLVPAAAVGRALGLKVANWEKGISLATAGARRTLLLSIEAPKPRPLVGDPALPPVPMLGTPAFPPPAKP